MFETGSSTDSVTGAGARISTERCARQDLNLHDLAVTGSSGPHVYRNFRHSRVVPRAGVEPATSLASEASGFAKVCPPRLMVAEGIEPPWSAV